MRNTRQGLSGSEGIDAPTLQQLMETMRALQEANEQYKQEQERIQEEAKAEQERLRAKAWAEQVLLQDQLMVEIEASRAANEELRKTNNDLRRNIQQHEQHSTREQGLNLPLRDCPKPFSQAIMGELMPPHYITPKIVFTGWKTLRIISRHSMPRWLFMEEWMQFNARCSWAHSQVQPYSGSVGFLMATSPPLSSSPDYLENSSLSTRLSLQCCMTSSTWDKGRGVVEGLPQQILGTYGKTPDPWWSCGGHRFWTRDRGRNIQRFVDQKFDRDILWDTTTSCCPYQCRGGCDHMETRLQGSLSLRRVVESNLWGLTKPQPRK